MPAPDCRLGVDVGGTNTDAVIMDAADRVIAKAKVPGTADITSGTALGATQLNATVSCNGSPLSGTFTYTLADAVTPASGAVLDVGPGQILNVTFTPDSTAFPSASAQVRINVV